MDLLAGWRFALRRLLAGWQFMAVAAVGVVVAATLLAMAPMYASSMSDLGLRFRLDRGLADPFDRLATIEVDRLLLGDPADQARREAVDAITEARVGWLGSEVLQEERTPRLDVSFVGYEDQAPEFPVKVEERGAEPVRQPWGGFVYALSGLEDHVNVVEGRLPDPASTTVEVMLPDGFQKHAALGDRLRLEADRFNDCPPIPPSLDPTVAADEVRCRPALTARSQVVVTVVGFFRRDNVDDARWSLYRGFWDVPDQPVAPRLDNVDADDPVRALANSGVGQMPLFTTESLFLGPLAAAMPEVAVRHRAGVVVQTGHISVGDVDHAIASMQGWRSDVNDRLDLTAPARMVPLTVLQRFQNTQTFSTIPLLLILLQVVGIVLYYTVMVMAMLLDRQAEEIGVYRSRGANSVQLVGFNFVEGLVLAIPAALVGPWIAGWIVANLGRTPTFEPMTHGNALPVTVSAESFLLGIGGAAVALFAILLPAFIAARRGIVDVKHEESRPGDRSLIQRYYLDFAMVGFAAILLWQLDRRGSVFDPGSVGGWSSDPLLLLSPFVITLAVAGMLLRFYPPAIRLGVKVLLAAKGTAVAIGLRRTGRAPAAYARLMLLLVMAVSVGTFAASYGPTVAKSLDERALYQSGVPFRAALRNDQDRQATEHLAALEQSDGVLDGALAFRGTIRTTSGTELPLLAIDPAKAERLLWWRDDFADRELLSLLRLLQSRVLPGGGFVLPQAATAVQLQVKSNQLDRTFLRLRFRDANGSYVNSSLQIPEDHGTDWVTASASVPTGLVAPISLVSIISNDRLGQNLREDGSLTIDDIVAVVAGGDPVVLDDFEGPFGWTMYPGRAANETWEVVEGPGEAAQGRRAARWTWQRLISPQNRVFAALDPAVPLAAIVDRNTLGIVGVAEGGTAPLLFGKVQAPIAVRAVVDYFPTLQPGSGFIVVNAEQLRSLAGTVEDDDVVYPNELWLDFQPTFSLSQQLDLTERLVLPSETPLAIADPIFNRAQMLDAVRADPTLQASGSGILSVAFAAVLGLSTLGFVVALVVGARQRAVEFAVLRAVGSSGREILRALILEWGMVLALGVVLGVVLGRQVARIMLSFLSVTEDGTAVVPPFILETDWRTLAIGLGVFVATVAFALGAAWVSSMRRATAAQLRITQ